MSKPAFSLIELMVVIAIVAVLAAVALPAYKTYTARVAITKAYNILNTFGDTLKDYYAKNGSWPVSTEFNGQTITDMNQGGTFVILSGGSENVFNMAYQTTGTTAQVLGNVSDPALSVVPGYVAPVAATWGTNAALRYVIVDYDDIFYKVCGNWSPAGPSNPQDIPVAYLNSSCQCEQIQSIFGTTNDPRSIC